MDGYARSGDASRSMVEIPASDDGRAEVDEKAARVHHQHTEQCTSDPATAAAAAVASCSWPGDWWWGWTRCCWWWWRTGQVSRRSVVDVRLTADHRRQVERASRHQHYVRPAADKHSLRSIQWLTHRLQSVPAYRDGAGQWRKGRIPRHQHRLARHAYISLRPTCARLLARMSVSMSWNGALKPPPADSATNVVSR